MTTAVSTDAKKSIAAKLSEVLGEIVRVPKNGVNRTQNYKFATEGDVVDFIRPLLAARKLFLHQTLISIKREPSYQTQSGMTMWLTTVIMAYTWMDGESGETLPPQEFPGYGADTGDKDSNKALTSAEKYMLLKTFMVSTGDDPEADERVDKAQAAGEAAAGPRVRGRAPTAGQQRGGRSTIPSAPQIAEFSRLVKDAKLNGTEVLDFIGRALKVDTSAVEHTGAAVKNFIQRLSADQVGMLIRTLSEPVGKPSEAPATETATEAAPEGPVDAAGTDSDTSADELGF